MNGRISLEERAAYRGLIALLLPPNGDMPGGVEVGVCDAGLDRVLQIRPDLAADLLGAIRRSMGDEDITVAVDRLRDEDGGEWRALRLAAFGAYYNAEPVQTRMGYAGQPSNPFDADAAPSFVTEGLLAPVMARKPFWRPA